MSIEVRNITNNSNFDPIDLDVYTTSSTPDRVSVSRGTPEKFKDNGVRKIVIEFMGNDQPIDQEKFVTYDLDYPEECIEYIIDEFSYEIVKYDANRITRRYKLTLIKIGDCPELNDGDTHIDIGFKHP